MRRAAAAAAALLAARCGGSGPPQACTVDAVIGCFFDGSPPDYTRTFPVEASSSVPGGMTQEGCASACDAMNYKFSGVEYAKQCFCGNTVAKAKKEPLADCDAMTCKGDSSQQCGGNNRLLVFNATCRPAPPGPPPVPNFHGCVDPKATALPYCDTSLSLDARVEDLIGRLSLEEKIDQISPARSTPTLSKGVDAIGLPDYNWLTEANTVIQAACLGPDRCPIQFPGPMNIGASFNRTNFKVKGRVLSTEQRALGNARGHECFGCPGRDVPPLTGWGPNINIARDPRFGRTSELPGEDPFLSGTYASEMVHGMQEEDARGHPRVLAYLKHYTAFDGAQGNNDEAISMHDLHETYLAQYKIAFTAGNATGAMCSYNKVNGVTACGNAYLLNGVIREQWGRTDAQIGTDWGAMPKGDAESSAVQALNSGVDLEMGSQIWPKHLAAAVRKGRTSEANVTRAVRRAFRPLFRAGRFDPVADVEWAQLPPGAVNSTGHQSAIHDAALQGVVLLRNENGTLPLRKGAAVAVVGPMAVARSDMISDYGNGKWRRQNACYNPAGGQGGDECIPTIADSVAAANAGGATTQAAGVDIDSTKTGGVAAALALARAADAVVLALGIGHDQEHEGHDRSDTALPGQQESFALQVLALGKPTTVVLVNGGALAVDAVLQAGPGAVVEAFNIAFGAPALAASLFGDANRWGKLPVTMYPHSFVKDAAYSSFDMSKAPGRTYKYYTGEPLFKFGHGLSLTEFSLSCAPAAGSALPLSVACEVRNVGGRDGDEVVMAFHSAGDAVRAKAAHPVPRRALIGFDRVSVPKGGSAEVRFTVTSDDVSLIDEAGVPRLYPGSHSIILSRGHGEEQTMQVTV